MTNDVLTLYYKVHCRLACPFPRLNALRANPQLGIHFQDEYKELVAKEKAYWDEYMKDCAKLNELMVGHAKI